MIQVERENLNSLSISCMLLSSGWIYTFEEYFNRATKHIIDTVISILNTNSKYKFIWAEMSFLSLWWDQATMEQRQLLKKLVGNGQLEIVTGGWVSSQKG